MLVTVAAFCMVTLHLTSNSVQEARIPEIESCTQGFQQEEWRACCRSCCPICPIALVSIDLPESAGNPSDTAAGRCDFACLACEPPLKYSWYNNGNSEVHSHESEQWKQAGKPVMLKPKCKSTLNGNKKSFRHKDTSDLREISKAWLLMRYSSHNVD